MTDAHNSMTEWLFGHVAGLVGTLVVNADRAVAMVSGRWWLLMLADLVVAHATNGRLHFPTTGAEAVAMLGEWAWNDLTAKTNDLPRIVQLVLRSARAQEVIASAKTDITDHMRRSDTGRALLQQMAMAGPLTEESINDWIHRIVQHTGFTREEVLAIRLAAIGAR